ncbi:hypothetical protein Ahia01_001207400 [Argonauta hians]
MRRSSAPGSASVHGKPLELQPLVVSHSHDPHGYLRGRVHSESGHDQPGPGGVNHEAAALVQQSGLQENDAGGRRGRNVGISDGRGALPARGGLVQYGRRPHSLVGRVREHHYKKPEDLPAGLHHLPVSAHSRVLRLPSLCKTQQNPHQHLTRVR